MFCLSQCGEWAGPSLIRTAVFFISCTWHRTFVQQGEADEWRKVSRNFSVALANSLNSSSWKEWEMVSANKGDLWEGRSRSWFKCHLLWLFLLNHSVFSWVMFFCFLYINMYIYIYVYKYVYMCINMYLCIKYIYVHIQYICIYTLN